MTKTKTVKKSKKKVDKVALMSFLKLKARELTYSRTKWEVIIYGLLKEQGILFEFQEPIITKNGHGYIADFLIKGTNLIIEIDGKQWHGTKEQQKKDNLRSRRLRKDGYEILRLWNSQVSVCSKQDLIKIIKQAIDNATKVL